MVSFFYAPKRSWKFKEKQSLYKLSIEEIFFLALKDYKSGGKLIHYLNRVYLYKC